MDDPKRSNDPTLLPAPAGGDAGPGRRDDDLGRRGALIRMMEVGVAVAGTALLTSGASEKTAEARRPPPPIEPQSPLVSLQIETPEGADFPAFRHAAQLWIAGREGQRYNLRLQNHSPERVEVVVSVDGRDVISGRLGDYARQRGYVIDPFEVLLIEGYRQSLDQVAAFRFADLEDSYTARLGTATNVGIIGVAAFAEKVCRRRRKRALAPVEGDPFPGEEGVAAPSPSAVVSGAERGRRRAARRGEGEALSWAAPEQPNQLGTEFGESTFAPVEEVKFKRKHRKKPDQLVVVRYDSMAGLRARGVISAERPSPPRPVRTWERRPRPRDDRFAPPPPPKDWWR